jgi:hypothetical protein
MIKRLYRDVNGEGEGFIGKKGEEISPPFKDKL